MTMPAIAFVLGLLVGVGMSVTTFAAYGLYLMRQRQNGPRL